jgi:hypothetical protein
MHDNLIRTRVPLRRGWGWLIRATNGGPVRPIPNGRRHRPVGNFWSVKNGRMLPWQSKLELYSLWRAEVRTDVVKSSVRPFMVEAFVDDGTYRYICTRQDLLANGKTEIVEVKAAIEAEKDPLYFGKLDLAAEICRSLGWLFRVEDRAQIQAEPAFATIRTIVGYARTDVGAIDLLALDKVFGARDTISLDEVQAALGSGVRGLASTSALVVQRRLGMNPADGLRPNTSVHRISTEAHHD